MDFNGRNFGNVPVLWRPKQIYESRKKFIKTIEDKFRIKIRDYWDLHKWSVDHIDEFWFEVWNLSDIIYSQKFKKVINLEVPMSERPEWFEGAKLNFAENLLKLRNDKYALISAGEDKETEYITFKEMHEKAKLYAAAFRKFGLKKGDRVVCYMSNRAEPYFAMLGAVSIGAIWTGALPLLGAQAVLNRLKQINPKLLLTVDRYSHDKEEKEMLYKVTELVEGLPSLEKVIIVASKEESKTKDISGIRNSCFLEEFLMLGYNEDGTIPELEFEQVSVSHPVFISYTSGTTGMPKALVHGSGPLLATSRDYWLHVGGERSMVFLSMSPVGWATWNIFSSFLSVGGTIVAYEGFPYFISPTYLWDIVDEFKITDLFLTPSILDDLEKKGYIPTEKHQLTSLISISCGGSVVKLQNFDFVYNKIKRDLRFFSGYGSTELMGTCMTSDTSIPLYRGEITCPALGVDLECLDDSGNKVIGKYGEMVIRKTAPNLPLGLWNDEDGALYKKTYFSKFPGKFAIGDLAIINPITKGIIIFCRSDETLKQRGCRFGSSEIYNVVNLFPEIKDSLCVSQYSKKASERAVLFVQMQNLHSFNEDLISKIRLAIEKELSAEHIPDLIMETKDVPHNFIGKKMEIIVKKIINNLPYNDENVRNKECLEFFRYIPPYED